MLIFTSRVFLLVLENGLRIRVDDFFYRRTLWLRSGHFFG
jgi:hypothetical protein